jgi:hypothetical protein
MDGFDVPAAERVFGPYPSDILTYRSERVVEFRTPADADGLGTRSFLPKNKTPIQGAVVLVGPTPDLVHLSVRLSASMARFAAAIIVQLELDAAHLSNK